MPPVGNVGGIAGPGRKLVGRRRRHGTVLGRGDRGGRGGGRGTELDGVAELVGLGGRNVGVAPGVGVAAARCRFERDPPADMADLIDALRAMPA